MKKTLTSGDMVRQSARPTPTAVATEFGVAFLTLQWWCWGVQRQQVDWSTHSERTSHMARPEVELAVLAVEVFGTTVRWGFTGRRSLRHVARESPCSRCGGTSAALQRTACWMAADACAASAGAGMSRLHLRQAEGMPRRDRRVGHRGPGEIEVLTGKACGARRSGLAAGGGDRPTVLEHVVPSARRLPRRQRQRYAFKVVTTIPMCWAVSCACV